MVKLELTTEQAELLATVIDGAQFNGNVAQAEEVFNAIQELRNIKAMLLVKEKE
jgi:hypothetical protein